MDDHRRPLRSASVKWRILDEEGVLVDLDSQTYFTLNAVGLFIWDHCNGEFSPNEICRDLALEFEVDESLARGDLEEFLVALTQRGLIEYLQTPAAAS